MKFYLDEHINPAIGYGLELRGFDVRTVQQEGKRGLLDTDHLKFAFSESRVIVTSDKDFLILDSKGHSHKGIIFLTDFRKPLGDIIRSIEKIAFFLSEKQMENHIEFV